MKNFNLYCKTTDQQVVITMQRFYATGLNEDRVTTCDYGCSCESSCNFRFTNKCIVRLKEQLDRR